jgi:ABC-type antimicrobial peptide transport system permease subunit
LGVIVLRNVLERRSELALLLAVGLRRGQVRRLVSIEHGMLLLAGLGLGLAAAAVAVLPTLLAPGAQAPPASLFWILLAVLLNGAAWTWGAVVVALRGELLNALRAD